MNEAYKSYSSRITTIPPILFGYRLLNFSLGHSIILKASNSKFVNGEYNKLCDINHIVLRLVSDESLLGEFAFALLVCSTTYDDFKEEVANCKFQEALNQMTNDIKGKGGKNLAFDILSFANYIKQGTDAPLYEVKENENESKSIPIEPEEAIVSTLMTECNWTRNDCYNLPMTETLSAYLVYAHRMGSIELIDKDVYELQRKLKGIK
jgi:hypothetical protein